MRSACSLLLARMMAGEPVPKEPMMIGPREVVERESTNVLATTDIRIIDIATKVGFHSAAYLHSSPEFMSELFTRLSELYSWRGGCSL